MNAAILRVEWLKGIYFAVHSFWLVSECIRVPRGTWVKIMQISEFQKIKNKFQEDSEKNKGI